MPVAFPHYVGPGTRGLTTVLLYHGKLGVCTVGWPSGNPLHAFFRVSDRALETSSELLRVFGFAYHHLSLAQQQARVDREGLAVLKGKVATIVCERAARSAGI